jgi:hypothetical protein
LRQGVRGGGVPSFSSLLHSDDADARHQRELQRGAYFTLDGPPRSTFFIPISFLKSLGFGDRPFFGYRPGGRPGSSFYFVY